MELPGFEILDRLGTGGMANVWKARQVSLDRIVAIKTLSRQFSTDPSDVQNFIAEAQSAARLKHPGIVQVYDANAIQGLYYIVMEFIDGRTVGEHIRIKGRLEEKDVLRIARSVAEALDHAWRKEGLIHCDIKPDNIMIDADGTVKVADLGLARTIRALRAQRTAEEVMGTPSYMSPEQVEGRPDLDCRADIYSLGATLYYALTGVELFGGYPYTDILRMQLFEQVSDPMDLSPKVSRMCSALIERMLAKDPGHRPRNWEELLDELARVQKHKMPRRILPSHAVSTIRRSPKREPPSRRRNLVMATRDGTLPATPARRVRPTSPTPTRVVLLVVLVLLAMVFALMQPAQNAIRRRKSLDAQARRQAEEQAVARRLGEALLQEVRNFIRDNPGRYDEAIARCEALASRCVESAVTAQARSEADRLRSEKQRAIRDVLDGLRLRAEPLSHAGNFLEAARVYEEYSGLLALETAEDRRTWADRLRERHRQAEEERKQREAAAETRWKNLLEEAISYLLARGPGSVLRLLENALTDTALASRKEEMERLIATLRSADAIEERVLASFKAQAGKPVTVVLHGKKHLLTVLDARDGRIICEEVIHTPQGKETRGVRFSPTDLPLADRIDRMGTDDDPGVALGKGLLWLNAGVHAAARDCFSRTDPLLREPLLRAVDAEPQKLLELQAEKDLVRILDAAGIVVGLFDADAWLQAVTNRTVNRETARRLREEARAFRARYGNTAFANRAERILDALERLRVTAEEQPNRQPEDKPFQVKVTEALVFCNTGLLPSDIRWSVDPDGGLRLQIVSSILRDLRPLESVRSLRALVYTPLETTGPAGWTRAPLDDLSPLAGLRLKRLALPQTSLTDLSALRGMPLTHVDISRTLVRDLSPLTGLRLEVLNAGQTGVMDLTPLKGMPLRTLHIHGTAVNDLSPLKGLPLEYLDVSDSRIRDLSPLEGLPLRSLDMARTAVSELVALAQRTLTRLNLSHTKVENIDILEGQPITELILDNTRVRDLSPLRAAKLRVLSACETRVHDLRPLAGMPLRVLRMGETRVRDLTPLRGLPLEELVIQGTKVEDLTPLLGMPLRHLNIRNTAVRSLAPLAACPLVYFDCRENDIDDYRVLEQLPIQVLWVDKPDGPIRRVLSLMPQLREVNGTAWAKW